MILQKSARFLMICLCAIIFHGNVFGDDIDFNCDKYVLTIPGEENTEGEIVGEYNICVSPDASMACNEKEKSCICKNGYETVDNPGQPCKKCGKYFYSNQTYTGGKCERCNGIIKTTSDGRNDGCEQCPEGKMPNLDHSECALCAEGYGPNDKGECVKCGDGTESVLLNKTLGYECTKCEFGTILQQVGDELVCAACSGDTFPNSTQTECVPSCSGDGEGKFTEKGKSQCVQCSTKNMTLSGGECVSECPDYTVENNGKCEYCDTDMFYDAAKHSCVSTCSNSFVATTTIKVCCNGYEEFKDGQCKPCEKTQWFNNDAKKCENCPKNFSCDGQIKTKCPFGEVSDKGKGVCEVPDITNKGFLYKAGAEYKVITEDPKDEYLNEYLNNTDETYLSNFEYADCDNVNGVSEPGHFTVNKKDVDVQICHECDKNTRRPVGSKCVCGERGTEPQAGLVGGFGEHENVCQICPNGVDIGNGMGDYVCNGCSDGKGFYWNEKDKKYTCKKPCPASTALYTDKYGYGWCLPQDDYKNAIGDNKNEYYVKDNSWKLCPAGDCCLGGKAYTCSRGTYSLVNGGLACNKEAYICLSCNGKTTQREETACPYGEDKSNLCQRAVCTESITPTKFCVVPNKEDHSQNMCFEIDKIKMTLATGAGVYNTKDVTGQ